ncbi:hypothetical protein MNBD_GAMMA09-1957 [hydrothermal vent metagenome]|uniref:Uncharacterized protein n=1 Tax=hydrothermal vent metagenome TaxID=652676 RepID=A0A3B0Y0S9_9ZZZZ
MRKKISIFVLIFNVSALLWGVYSFYTLSNSPIDAAILKIKETPQIANEALATMEEYSDSEKIKRVSEIIDLYKELTGHISLTKQATVESIETMSSFVNYFIIFSIINVSFLGYLLYLNRFNFF